jgi:4-amino-4-deoxy-L-arabinose transferase-like glycosyltransferase
MLLDSFSSGRIILLAVVLRLCFGLIWVLFINRPAENVPVDGDTWFQAGADGYVQIARTLLISGEYAFHPDAPPVHNRPPVQVVLLLFFGAWLPSHWFIVWIFASALLSWLLLLCIRILCRELDMSRRSERLTLLLSGFHPYMVFISKTTTFINIAALLLAAVTVAALRIRRHPYVYSLASGLLCGIGALTHGVFLLLPLLITVLITRLRALPMLTRLASMLLVLSIATAVIAPWTLRNISAFGSFIPVVTGNGYHYWKGEAVYFGGDYPMAEVYTRVTGKPFEEMYYGAVDPAADAILWSEAKRDMLSRPWRIPQRLFIGSLAFFAPWDSSYFKALVSAMLNIPLLLALAYFGVRALRAGRLRLEHFALAFLLLYVVESFAFFVAWGSYFTMIVPIALTLAVSLRESGITADYTDR